MSISVRSAQPADLNWINEKYDEVNFQHSTLENEIVAIASWRGRAAGLGRIHKVADGEAELGGMYVFPDFRKKGIAGQIVRFLLAEGAHYRVIWCLPFAHLQAFYGQFGFAQPDPTRPVPAKVAEKLAWCNQTYPEPVLLLARYD